MAFLAFSIYIAGRPVIRSGDTLDINRERLALPPSNEYINRFLVA